MAHLAGSDVRCVLWLSLFFFRGAPASFLSGPRAWSSTPPVIPGFHAVPLGGGGFIEEPDPPAVQTETPIETVITGLEQAQKVRTLTRQLAR